MRQAVVIDAIRTPVGRAHAENGIFRDVRSEDLSAHVMEALVQRSGIDPRLIDDIRWAAYSNRANKGSISLESQRWWPDFRSRRAASLSTVTALPACKRSTIRR
jgi:acetyl-CoA acetyltransferase